MPNITSFKILETEIEKISGNPKVLEVLWDGDTDGWFLIVNLYSEKVSFFRKKKRIDNLGTISLGGDIRLFNGEAPDWSEAELAKQLGRQAIEKYGLTFYFPSDKEPDSDCPSWENRHLAISCKVCGKSIIPSDSPYLPKNICYSCHLDQEQEERLKLNECYKDGMYGRYKINNSSIISRDYSINFYLKKTLKDEELINEVTVIKFDNDELLVLKEILEVEIEENIKDYKETNVKEELRKFGIYQNVDFKNKTYELEIQFNENHKILSSLIYLYETFAKAESEVWTYYLNIIKGITHRDDAFLRFINFVCKGSTNIKILHDRYKKILAETDIVETLDKLKRLDCIEIENEDLKITERGQSIL